MCVGSGGGPAWEEASRATGGRVIAAGVRDDIVTFYEAADVYLETYPCGSSTAVLEAAAMGMPVVAFCPAGLGAEVLVSEILGLPAKLRRQATTLEALAASVNELLADHERRETEGRATANAVERAYGIDAWRVHLEHLLALACAAVPATAGELAALGEPGRLDEVIHILHRRTVTQPGATIRARHAAVFPVLEVRGAAAWAATPVLAGVRS